MFLVFLASLIFIITGCAGFHYAIRLRGLNSGAVSHIPEAACRAYQPMLRLLSAEDLQITASSPELYKQLRIQRRRIFRSYLRCLEKDYSRLLGGVRWIMVNSSVDRPDLAMLLARQQRAFAIAVCRIEWKLALHSIGIENVKLDVSGLVSAVDNLTGIVNVFRPVHA